VQLDSKHIKLTLQRVNLTPHMRSSGLDTAVTELRPLMTGVCQDVSKRPADLQTRGELHHLLRLHVPQAVHPGDAVADGQHPARLLQVRAGVRSQDLLLQEGRQIGGGCEDDGLGFRAGDLG